MRTIWFQRGGPGGSAFRPHRGAATPGQKLAQIGGGRSAKAQSPCSTGSQRAEDRLGPDGVFQLCADYVAGRPSTALVRSYGLSKGAELRLLEVSGISRRHRGLTETHVKEAVEWYLRGWPLTRIGDYFGKDHTVVRNALVREGVALRARRRDHHSAVQQPTSGSDVELDYL
jgi:hypothetical protein